MTHLPLVGRGSLPEIELSVDHRAKILFEAALEEFQIGFRQQQLCHVEPEGTAVFFSPDDIEGRRRSTRRLLGPEPMTAPDDIAPTLFSQVYTFSRGS